jgi:hypothetical protein
MGAAGPATGAAFAGGDLFHGHDEVDWSLCEETDGFVRQLRLRHSGKLDEDASLGWR